MDAFQSFQFTAAGRAGFCGWRICVRDGICHFLQRTGFKASYLIVLLQLSTFCDIAAAVMIAPATEGPRLRKAFWKNVQTPATHELRCRQFHLFGFVEEYILANTVQYANAEMFGDRDAVRALCRFADEEAKHMLLFARYRKVLTVEIIA